MKRGNLLGSHASYARELRRLLPERAFLPQPGKLGWVALHSALIVSGYCGLALTRSVAVSVLLALLIGHSLACQAFLAHELSHDTIVRNRPVRYALELWLWGLNFIPVTMWRRVHNQTHHVHTNTPRDPDRRFMHDEQTWLTKAYGFAFYPQRGAPRYNPFVLVHFVPYILRNVAAAFYSDTRRPQLAPFKPAYTGAQRLRIVAELGVIGVLQVGIFHAVGGRWSAYLWASPVAILVASAVVMAYVFTNHFANPLCETSDPLATTTSVIVPSWIDRLHLNFSYHTEHHLFPGMRSEHYPQLSALLAERHGSRYRRLPIGSVWRALWDEPELVGDEVERVSAPTSSAWSGSSG